MAKNTILVACSTHSGKLRLPLLALLALVSAISTEAVAQVPEVPKVPAAAAKSAEKAAAAQKAAEKAAVAQKAAEKASVAQKAAEKAGVAQKAAEKAQVAQKAAEKAAVAQKAAEKAQVAQKAAEKAQVAQRSAEKAAVAQKAAEKASVAQKAAEKASVAQKAAEKAAVAQKAAEKSLVAEKAAAKAQAAQKAAEKAAAAEKSIAAQKAAEKAQAAAKAAAAGKASDKAAVAQKAAEKSVAAEKAAIAQKAAEKAAAAEKSIAAQKAAEKSAAAEKAAIAQKAAEKTAAAQKPSGRLPLVPGAASSAGQKDQTSNGGKQRVATAGPDTRRYKKGGEDKAPDDPGGPNIKLSEAAVQRLKEEEKVPRVAAETRQAVGGRTVDQTLRDAVRDAGQDNAHAAPGVRVGQPKEVDDAIRTVRDRDPAAKADAPEGSDEGTVAGARFQGKEVKGAFSGILPERGVNTDLAGSVQDNKPGTDQGFRDEPDNDEVAAAAGKLGGNPVKGVASGGIGGPLGTAAASDPQGGLRGIAAQGNGAVSDGIVENALAVFGVVGGGSQAVQSATTLSQPTIALVNAIQTGTQAGTLGGSSVSSVFGAGTGAAVSGAVSGVTAAAVAGLTAGVLVDKAYQAATDSTIGDDWADLDQKKGLGIGTATLAIEDAVRDLFGTPDPENRHKPRFGVFDLNPGIAQQIAQAGGGKPVSQGGGGDITPADNDDMGVSGASKLSSAQMRELEAQRKNNMIGNPEVAGGLVDRGSINAGPDYGSSTGAGSINPGPEGTVTSAGGIKENEGDFFDDRPRQSAPPPRQNSGSGSTNSSTSSSSGGGKNEDD